MEKMLKILVLAVAVLSLAGLGYSQESDVCPPPSSMCNPSSANNCVMTCANPTVFYGPGPYYCLRYESAPGVWGGATWLTNQPSCSMANNCRQAEFCGSTSIRCYAALGKYAYAHEAPAETCNNVDDDCDGHVDEGCPTAKLSITPSLAKWGDSIIFNITNAPPSSYVFIECTPPAGQTKCNIQYISGNTDANGKFWSTIEVPFNYPSGVYVWQTTDSAVQTNAAQVTITPQCQTAIDCKSPPPTKCVGSLSVTYAGVCYSGSCAYNATSTTCQNGCDIPTGLCKVSTTPTIILQCLPAGQNATIDQEVVLTGLFGNVSNYRWSTFGQSNPSGASGVNTFKTRFNTIGVKTVFLEDLTPSSIKTTSCFVFVTGPNVTPTNTTRLLCHPFNQTVELNQKAVLTVSGNKSQNIRWSTFGQGNPSEKSGVAIFSTRFNTSGVKIIALEDFTVGAGSAVSCAVNVIGHNTTLTPSPPPQSPKAEYNLSLKKGWNLISVPVAESTPIQFREFQNNCVFTSPLWGYSNLSKSYYKSSTATSLQNVKTAFWQRVDENCVVMVQGDFKTSAEWLFETNVYELSQGWNLIGGANKAYRFAEIKGDCTFTRGPYSYDTESSQYRESTTMEPGRGYIVGVERACRFADTSSHPPALPTIPTASP